MYHFFVEQEQIGEGVIAVTGPDVNHIKNVLRMKPGERVLISAKAGGDYLCVTKELAQDKILFGILEKSESEMELPARIHLFQGLPKGDKMELIIQKAEARIKRWNAISESAAKQSKRSIIPEVTGVVKYKDALQMAEDFGLKMIPYECAKGMEETRRLLQTAEAGMDIAIFIGPEGGFEEEEIRQAGERGVSPASLGRRILRTETAGLCVLSALMISLDR